MGIFLKKKMKKKIDSAQHLRALDYLEWLRLPIYFCSHFQYSVDLMLISRRYLFARLNY